MSDESLLYELVRKYGRSTTSFQTLGAHFQHWFDGDDAYVAYTDVGASWVVAGGPVAPPERELEVMERFSAEARRHGKRVRFFMLERDVTGESSFATQHIGDHPVWDPSDWPKALGKKLRDQLRRARTKGLVTTRLVTHAELSDVTGATRRGMDRVIAQWLDSRKIAPLGFLLELDLFNRSEERRYFVAEFEGDVVGVMIALPVYARKGWFVDNMLRSPNAPNGTIELMFDCMMTTLAAEGSHHVTLGLSPFVNTTSPLMRFFRDFMGVFYNFKGLHAFKRKLRPSCWEPMYIAFPREERGASATMSVITSFLHGSWSRFYWDSLIQRANASTAFLAADLAIWLGVGFLFGGDRWFWSRANLGAWGAFDGLILVMMLALSRRFTRWGAVVVSGLSVANAALFGAQIAGYSASHAQLLDWTWLPIGVVLPLFISRFLWESRNRYQGVAIERVRRQSLGTMPVANDVTTLRPVVAARGDVAEDWTAPAPIQAVQSAPSAARSARSGSVRAALAADRTPIKRAAGARRGSS